MSNKWFSSDLHFGHKNILKFCPESRPYETVEEMNEAIITNINNLVQPDDELYLLGDIAFCSASEAVRLLKRVNGRKFLIVGNHDHKLVQNKEFCDQFESVEPYKEIYINHGDKRVPVVMFHYPIYEFNRQHHGAYHLYGHVHGKKLAGMQGRSLDVGLDSKHPDGEYMKPFSVGELEYLLGSIPAMPHH